MDAYTPNEMLIRNGESENLDDVDAFTPNEMLIRNGESENLDDVDAYTPNEEMKDKISGSGCGSVFKSQLYKDGEISNFR